MEAVNPSLLILDSVQTVRSPAVDGTVAVTTHGETFASVVDRGDRGDVCGMQFHPEKSGRAGLTLLRNWVRRCSASA